MILVMKNEQVAQQVLAAATTAGLQNVYVHEERVGFATIKTLAQVPFVNEADVAEVIEKHPAALKSSRLFHPADTVITTAHSTIGGDNFVLMAGPDSIESADHVLAMGAAVQEAGATLLRGGSYKPRTSPYSFQGLGEAGLQMDTRDVEIVGQYTDIFQVGTRNMQNFSLLKALGQQNKPVALKRGMSASIDELLSAAEYIASEGNDQIILIERGIRTFDNKYTRNTMDVSAIPVLQELTHYPVLADPSHAAGVAHHVTSVGLAAVAAGAQGLMVEIHDHPEAAFVDGAQALTPAQFTELADKARAIHEIVRG